APRMEDGSTASAERGSFDERDLVDLAQRRDALQHLLHRGLAQESHAFIARGLLDFRGRAPREDHLADVVAQIEQLADRPAAAVTRPAALHASGAFEEQAAGL